MFGPLGFPPRVHLFCNRSPIGDADVKKMLQGEEERGKLQRQGSQAAIARVALEAKLGAEQKSRPPSVSAKRHPAKANAETKEKKGVFHKKFEDSKR